MDYLLIHLAFIFLGLLCNVFCVFTGGITNGYLSEYSFRGGSYGNNLIIRIGSPVLFIGICWSIASYLAIEVNLVWLVGVYYVITNILWLLFFQRFSVSSKLELSIFYPLIIIITYLLYSDVDLVSFHIRDINFGFIILGIYLIQFAIHYSSDEDKDWKRYNKWIHREYFKLHSKFASRLEDTPFNSSILEDVFFSVMLVEHYNRPTGFRFIERMLFPFGIVKSTGIMQITSTKPLTDEQSVVLAIERLTPITNMKNQTADNLIAKAANVYNNSDYKDLLLQNYSLISRKNIQY